MHTRTHTHTHLTNIRKLIIFINYSQVSLILIVHVIDHHLNHYHYALRSLHYYVYLNDWVDVYASKRTWFSYVLCTGACVNMFGLDGSTERRLNDLMFYQLLDTIHCYCLCAFSHLFYLSCMCVVYGIHFTFSTFHMNDKIEIGWLKTKKRVGIESRVKWEKKLVGTAPNF